MTDERLIEASEEQVARELEARIKAACVAGPEVKATGRCLFCHETVAAGTRWCDSDCRDDWQAERMKQSRQQVSSS